MNALAGYPKSTTAFQGAYNLGLVNLGGSYSNDSIATHTYTSNAIFNISTGTLPAGYVSAALLGSSFVDAGFDSLRFRIINGAATVVDETFTTAAAAENYFDDTLVNLGVLDSTHNLQLTFETDFTTNTPDSEFYATMLTGITAQAVPEPPAWALLTAGLSVLLAARRFRRGL
jgi:hypothetical protein